MDITVAGPGAGKTTNLAKEIISNHRGKREHKRVFVITFTNSAKTIISKELSKLSTPIHNVSVSTIHSFLLSEVVFPYHHFLYQDRITRAISRDLPSVPSHRQKQLSDMRKRGFVDNSEVFRYAKYIICGKSSDKKSHKLIRRKILEILSSYISHIYIDEAQDIDLDIVSILEVFEASGIQIHLIGDPKQDIRASRAFYNLVRVRGENVGYISENYRCPQKHVAFMNLFVENEEIQVSKSELSGNLEYIFGDIANLNKVMQEPWDLAYIVERNEEFRTTNNQLNSNPLFDNLSDIIKELTANDWERDTFIVFNQLKNQSITEPTKLISLLQARYKKKLSNTQMARIYSLDLNNNRNKVESLTPIFSVSSIDSAKGEEGDRCLFIFTTDFINHLKNPKLEMNKTKSRFYVAISRSKRLLTFLLDKKVVSILGKNNLKSLLEPHGFKDVTDDYM